MLHASRINWEKLLLLGRKQFQHIIELHPDDAGIGFSPEAQAYAEHASGSMGAEELEEPVFPPDDYEIQ